MSDMKHLSDDTIRGVRERLIARGVELRERLLQVDADLGRTREPLPADSSEAAIAVENDEVLHALEDGARLEMSRIEQALARLNSGTFAICEGCGGEIEEQRLRIVPIATHCRRCAPDA